MQRHPTFYAQKIIDLLAQTSYDNAEIALRIAGDLLDYRFKCEFSEGMAVDQEDVAP